MARMAWCSPFSSAVFTLLLLWGSSSSAVIGLQPGEAVCGVTLVAREQSRTIASTKSGTITAVDIDDGYRGRHHLQFFTLEPQSLLLPLLLHMDMVFYVHTGRGTVSWVDEGEKYDLEVESGDIYRIGSGSVIYMRSHPDPMREKLRVYAIFSTLGSEVPPAKDAIPEVYFGAYSNLSDLVRGFDENVLRMGFRVPAEVISDLKEAERPPPIVPFAPRNETEDGPTWKEGIFEALIGGGRPWGPDDVNGKKKKKPKTKTFNIQKAKPDVENCNGRSIAVNDKDLHALKGSDIGVFLVNLTRGSMMGPHWNPLATEIAIVTHGRGMLQVALPSTSAAAGDGSAPTCRSLRFRVSLGDVFWVPRYHPMAQMSFNDDYFSFVGFSTRAKRNHPQVLAGKSSVLQILNKEILALSLGVPNTTGDQLLAAQEDAVMLECVSCAEEEEKRLEAEIERQKEEEEARRREEEEAKKREEEEEARRREEEKEARRREEEEEAKKREEEEEAGKREEEEEARRRKEEEEARRRQEEEARKRKEEEEEEAREREEEEQRRQREEEEGRRQEEERRRQEEEEEETRRREEEEERQRQEAQERARREEEEEEARRREEEGTDQEGGAGGGRRESFKPWRLSMV